MKGRKDIRDRNKSSYEEEENTKWEKEMATILSSSLQLLSTFPLASSPPKPHDPKHSLSFTTRATYPQTPPYESELEQSELRFDSNANSFENCLTQVRCNNMIRARVQFQCRLFWQRVPRESLRLPMGDNLFSNDGDAVVSTMQSLLERPKVMELEMRLKSNKWWEFQSLRRGVFLSFWDKRVTCTARDLVFIYLDGTKWRIRPKNKQLVVWGTGLQALVIRGAIQRIDGSLEGFFVFNPSYFLEDMVCTVINNFRYLVFILVLY
jgi:hypothetical protein